MIDTVIGAANGMPRRMDSIEYDSSACRRRPRVLCRRVRGRSVWLVIGVAAAAGAAHGHHSIAREYDGDRPLTFAGTVVKFHFVNPHPYLVVAAHADSASPQTWHLEMDNRYELARIGVTAETFAPGDVIVASGSPGRTKSRTLYLRRLERHADGLLYRQRGYTPTLEIVPR